MGRALMWLNLHCWETVRRKLKNRQKCIFCVFCLFLSLCRTASQPYEAHHCPLHQSILLTQGPIHEIFAKFFWELAILKNSSFWVGYFGFFFASSLWKLVKVSWVYRMGRNVNDYPGFQPKITPQKISAGSVYTLEIQRRYYTVSRRTPDKEVWPSPYTVVPNS